MDSHNKEDSNNLNILGFFKHPRIYFHSLTNNQLLLNFKNKVQYDYPINLKELSTYKVMYKGDNFHLKIANGS
jgi:hypothetical protein